MPTEPAGDVVAVPSLRSDGTLDQKPGSVTTAGEPLDAAPAPDAPEPPPRSGSGSGRDAWAAYAAALGVPVADEADRGDIIAALEAAGQAT